MRKLTTDKIKSWLIALAFPATIAPQLVVASPAMTGLVAEADSAEAAFAAPAGMSRLEGSRFAVQGLIATSFSTFEVDEDKSEVGGGDPDLGDDPIIVPSVFYVHQLNEEWHAGLSLTIPSGFGANYGNSWAGRYNTVDFSLVYVALTPALSYRVSDKLSLGGAMGINYTSQTSEVKVRQLNGQRDGKLTSELDGISANITLSMLYEFTERTRAGLSWTSDADADLEGNVRLRNLGPAADKVFTELGLKNINVDITNTLPQRALLGVYHQFDSGNSLTLDGLWMKFSDFTVTDLKLEGEDVNVSAPDIYDDIWAVTAGMGFPANERMTYKIGAMYVSSAVDDEDRGFSIRLDEMWGVGAGVSYKMPKGRTVELDATVINTGKAPVDTGKGKLLEGRIVGESDTPYTLLVNLTYGF